MQIFTPAKARSAAEERMSKDSRRAETIAETITELLKTQKEVETAFEETLRQHREISEQWSEEFGAKKRALAEEVKQLEERKMAALSPLVEREKHIHSREEALGVREVEMKERDAEFEDETRLLMRKLDEVSGREQDLLKWEKRLKLMEEGAQLQATQVAHGAKQLSLQMQAFYKDVEEKEMALAYLQSELDAQKKLQHDKEDAFKQREKELDDRKIQLLDERFLLEKGFEELRRLKNRQ